MKDSFNDNRVIMICNTAMTYVPYGKSTLVVEDGSVVWKSTACCCCKSTGQLSLAPVPLVQKESITCYTVLRDLFLSFVFAFLFHLIPSLIWTPEASLGSPDNHQKMGMVWFGGWILLWFPLFIFVFRPWGVKCASGDFIQMPTYEDAVTTVERWGMCVDSPGTMPSFKKPRFCKRPHLIGSFVLAVMLVWGLVTMSLVQECNGRGCCKDDASTLDACVATGYPSFNRTK